MNANSEAVKALNKQMVADAISNNRAVEVSNYKNEIKDTITNQFFDEDKYA